MFRVYKRYSIRLSLDINQLADLLIKLMCLSKIKTGLILIDCGKIQSVLDEFSTTLSVIITEIRKGLNFDKEQKA